jgi:MFS family permease
VTTARAAPTEPAEPDTGLRHAFAAFRYRDFTLFWSAALVSNTGNWMQSITVPYVLYRMTHSGTWLGIAAFANFFPALAVGPWAGSLADRFSRRTIVLITQTVQMIVAFSLWAVWVSGAATPWILLAHLLVYGAASGVNIASWQSFVPQLVPREALLGAVRLNSVQFTGARAFGPMLAGLVLAVFGPATSFMANALSFLLVIGALLMVHPYPAVVQPTSGSYLAHFREGIAYVRARIALSLPIVTITVVSLCGSAILQLGPAIAKDEFGVGKAAYGLLLGMFGAGAVVGALAMSVYGDRTARSRTAMAGLVIYTSGVLLLALAPGYAIGLAAMLVMGVAYLFVSVSLNTSIQVRVAETYRGRVLSIYLMGLLAGVPFGALIEGALADVIGLRATIAGAGALLLAYTLVMVGRFGAMAALDQGLDEDLEHDEIAAEALDGVGVDPNLGAAPHVPD